MNRLTGELLTHLVQYKIKELNIAIAKLKQVTLEDKSIIAELEAIVNNYDKDKKYSLKELSEINLQLNWAEGQIVELGVAGIIQ